MTRDEFKIIVVALKSNYRNFGIESKEQFEFWYRMLGDVEYNVMQMAVEKLVLELTFAPTIADIRKKVTEILNPINLTAAEAWGEVTKAISQFGYYRPEEAVQSMSQRTREVVKQIRWQEICSCQEPGVIRGQFMKMYDQVAGRERLDALIPERLKNDIQAIANRKDLKLIQGKTG